MSANSMNGAGLPVILVDQENRSRRPRERAFSKWIDVIDPEMGLTRELYKNKYGVEMTTEESYQFLAWSLEVALSRILWTVDDDPQALAIIASAAFDTRERYIGYRKGAYPPPNGQRFESPSEFELGIQAASAPVEVKDHGYGTYL